MNAVETEYEAENELNLIPSKQDSTKENKSVEMLDLLRSTQKELSNLRTDVNTLKKAKKEIKDHRDEQKDKYMCKRCLENDEEVCIHCWGGSYCQTVPVKSEKREGTEELRQSSVSCHGKPQYCIYCRTNLREEILAGRKFGGFGGI